MNSIAIPRKTDSVDFRVRDFMQAARSALAGLVLLVIWITFTPFAGVTIGFDTQAGSNALNQVGYLSLVVLAMFMLASAADRRAMPSLLSLPWLMLFALLVLAAVNSPDSAAAYRGAGFSLIAIMVAAMFVALPPNADSFSRILQVACIAVLALSYAGVAINPAAAIHQAYEPEAQHSGLWRGVFIHKNIAGPVMAAMVFSGIYLMRRRHWVSGTIIALAAAFFVWKTGSKTSFFLMPVVAVMIFAPSLFGMRALAAIAAVLAMIGAHLFTVGTVFSPALNDILRFFDPETTFTGRIEIWQFAKDYVLARPWTGFGYDGFWQTPTVMFAEQPFDRAWDPRNIIHGHNGFLDVVLVMGIPATALLVWALVVAPAYNYLNTPLRRENVLMSDLFFMIVTFCVMNAALESFFFRRADPVWLTLVFAAFGLRYVSRFAISSR